MPRAGACGFGVSIRRFESAKGFIQVANIKSQIKRNKQNEKARIRNRAVRSELKTAVKRVAAAVEQGNGELAQKEADKAYHLLDKAVAKGVIHKNQAANRKSGVRKLANKAA